MESNISKTTYIVVFLILLFLMIMGIKYQKTNNAPLQKESLIATVEKKSLSLIFTPINLRNLSKDHYESWIVTSEGTFSTGKFNINKDFQVVDLDNKKFTPKLPQDIDINKFIEYFITLEKQGDTNSIPSSSVILSGNFDKNQVTLNFKPDIKDISGNAILLEKDKILSGIEFPSFNLPQLTNGWKYQAWLKYDDKYYNIGKFSKANDKDDSILYSDIEQKVPGEYFIINKDEEDKFPLDLIKEGIDVEVLISIVPDTFSEKAYPFYLIPLKTIISKDLSDKKAFELKKNTINFPKAIITILQK